MITSLLSPDASSLGDIKELKEESRRDQRMCLHQWFDKRHKAVPTETYMYQTRGAQEMLQDKRRLTKSIVHPKFCYA